MNKLHRATCAAALIVACVAGAPAGLSPAHAEPAAAPADDLTTLYALGYALASRANGIELTEDELAAVQRGVADAMQGRAPSVALREVGPGIQALVERKITEATEARRARSAAFVAEQAAREGAATTPAGAVYLETEAGSGTSPAPDDRVLLHYHGTLPDGTVFDTSRGGDPANFAVGEVIPCFSEGVQRMSVGASARLVCPPEAAYGDVGSPPYIRPAQALIFDVELIGIVSDEPAAASPPEQTPPPTPTPTPTPTP